MKTGKVAGLVVVCLLAAGLAAGCAKQSEPEAGPPEAKPSAPSTADGGKAAVEAPTGAAIAQKTCPVMGGAINKSIYADHKGRRVYFCCAGCVDTFKKDPAMYLAKVDAEIGKSGGK